jgi:hypothetical protein
VLFFAVPPDNSHVYCYDELYLRDCDAYVLAERLRHKLVGHNFQAFIIDWHGSIRTEASGMRIHETYEKEFKKQRITSIASGNGFLFPAKADIETGCQRVREWLAPTPDGIPRLQVFKGCEHLIHEMERYHKTRKAGVIIDKPEQTGFHCVDSLRYAVMHGLKWKKPRPVKTRTPAQDYLDKKLKKHRQKHGDAIYLA